MQKKIFLNESDMPTHWYNIVADMPNKPLPPLNPKTKEPVGPEDLAPLFPMELIKQEVSAEQYIEIPDEVRDIYRIWRPTPMYRAFGLKNYWIHPRRFTISMRGFLQADRTSRTPR